MLFNTIYSVILSLILILNARVSQSIFGFNFKNVVEQLKKTNIHVNVNQNQNQNICNCNCPGRKKRDTNLYDKIPCDVDLFYSDVNDDLTLQEFDAILKKIAPRQQLKFRILFQILDSDDDELVSVSEFVSGAGHHVLEKIGISIP
ncbi:hypothetical protein KUTeg_015071 [Tegillarca granosa]|uniref:EF-hand domain-containing protein n=1 Tax=Tegillarca granosa TaxID=220873 RepID=A0ABQ9ETS9_TEGGR|nr:hypothetical protein KUTeg_015071 [Tegillarca granosa]